MSKTVTAPGHSHAFGGVPTCFRACCRTASGGGVRGYQDAGRMLCEHMPCPYTLEDDQWQGEKNGLREILLDKEATDEAALEWFDRLYPKCMALVPTRRRGQFIEGVYAALGNGAFE